MMDDIGSLLMQGLQSPNKHECKMLLDVFDVLRVGEIDAGKCAEALFKIDEYIRIHQLRYTEVKELKILNKTIDDLEARYNREVANERTD